MAKSDILEKNLDDPGGDPDWEWVVAKSLLDANAHAGQAFEHHLLRTYHSDASENPREIREHLRQAIDEHERIIEHLELAARAIDELDTTPPADA